jgi:hypothetical protein
MENRGTIDKEVYIKAVIGLRSNQHKSAWLSAKLGNFTKYEKLSSGGTSSRYFCYLKHNG